MTEYLLVTHWIRESDVLLHFVDDQLAREWTVTQSEGFAPCQFVSKSSDPCACRDIAVVSSARHTVRASALRVSFVPVIVVLQRNYATSSSRFRSRIRTHFATLVRLSNSVASLGLVSPGAATDGVAPIFPEKN